MLGVGKISPENLYSQAGLQGGLQPEFVILVVHKTSNHELKVVMD